MNRIRSWIVRTIFGPAQSEAPGDGQVREEHPGHSKTWLAILDGSDAHVIPEYDDAPHTVDPECICGPAPRLEPPPDGSDAWTYIHHSLDGREQAEPDRRQW